MAVELDKVDDSWEAVEHVNQTAEATIKQYLNFLKATNPKQVEMYLEVIIAKAARTVELYTDDHTARQIMIKLNREIKKNPLQKHTVQ